MVQNEQGRCKDRDRQLGERKTELNKGGVPNILHLLTSDYLVVYFSWVAMPA